MCGVANAENAQEKYPRFSFVACASGKAKNQSDIGVCFIALEKFCEKPDTSPFLGCMNQSIHQMADYIVANRDPLPATIDTKKPFTNRLYLSVKKRLVAYVPNIGVCNIPLHDSRLLVASEQHGETVERLAQVLCEAIHNSVAFGDLYTGARWAGIELPKADEQPAQ